MLFETIKEAINLYKNKEFWLKLQKKAMEYDFSWDISANKYYELYQKLLELNLGYLK